MLALDIKKYRRIRQNIKTQAVTDAEETLVNYSTLDRETFEEYLVSRALLTDLYKSIVFVLSPTMILLILSTEN